MYSPVLTPRRAIVFVLALVVGIHFLLTLFHEEYSRATSLNNLGLASQLRLHDAHSSPTSSNSSTSTSLSYHTPIQGPHGPRMNATLVMLARNGDINGVVQSMQSLEDRFNSQYKYPWIFLNDEPFTEEFKERVLIMTDAKVEFGLIPADHWQQPEWIDEKHARESREKMSAKGIIYASSVPYRNMCRFNSGFFFRHELLQPYRYYWRVEPSVKFFCNMDYDPFEYMRNHDKVYGFTITLVEWEATIPTLWGAVKDFMAAYPEHINKHNSLEFVSNDQGNSYNLCHFWSNFEIADMDFWRAPAYTDFFNYLESTGGFYYERWGDAPVHSIAAALLARRDQIHYFRDVGYQHESFMHCPTGEQYKRGKCSCDPGNTFDYKPGACTKRYEDLFS